MQNTPKAGQKLVVIGGCGGIGQAVVKMALEGGLEVAIFDLKKSIQLYPPPTKVLTFEVDATQENELQNAFLQLQQAWTPGFDFLVNLVGFIVDFKSVAELTESVWQETLEGNLTSLFLSCKMAIPYLRKGGGIVNMSSGLALVGRANYAPYSAAKAGAMAFTKSLAVELAPDIRVNVVAPGAVQTPFLSGGLGRGGDFGKTPTRLDLEAYKTLVPLQFVAAPKDVAAPILFLLSEGARHITGQTLHINGGALMV